MRKSAVGPLIMAAVIIFFGCATTTGTPITDVTGTWGGDDAGLIATDTSAHVHIGCTLGDTKGRIVVDAYGHFDMAGAFNVDAYPVDRGITHPAQFTGQISGKTMTLSVVLTDTGRQLGPVTLVLGKEPKMGPCPICRTPGELRQYRHQTHLIQEPVSPRRFSRPLIDAR